MRYSVLVIILVGCLAAPLIAIASLSVSPTTAMDAFSHWPPSTRWFRALISDAEWIRAVTTSLYAGCLSAALSLFIVVPCVAFWRLTGSRTAGVALLASAMPFAIPPIVLAVGLYRLVMRFHLFDTLSGLVFCHLAVTTPVVALSLMAEFRRTSTELFRVARSLGASPLRAASTWLIAAHSASLMAAAAAAVLVAMSEVTIAVYVTDTNVLTISRKVLSGITRDIDPTGFAAMALWILMIGSLATIVATRPERRHG